MDVALKAKKKEIEKIDQSLINISSKDDESGSSITEGNFTKTFVCSVFAKFFIKSTNCWHSIHSRQYIKLLFRSVPKFFYFCCFLLFRFCKNIRPSC